MGAGFQSFNEFGTVQFDTDNPNFAFVGKGQLATLDISENPGPQRSIGFIDGTLPTYDSVAISCATSPCSGGTIGGPDTNSLFCQAGPGSHIVNYYLFRSYAVHVPVSAHGTGLEIYDVNGRVTFSTIVPPLAVVAKRPVTNMYNGMNEVTATAAGRTYAFLNYGQVARQIMDNPVTNPDGTFGSTPYVSNLPGVQLVSGGYAIREIVQSGIGFGTFYEGGFLVVDVTGL